MCSSSAKVSCCYILLHSAAGRSAEKNFKLKKSAYVTTNGHRIFVTRCMIFIKILRREGKHLQQSRVTKGIEVVLRPAGVGSKVFKEYFSMTCVFILNPIFHWQRHSSTIQAQLNKSFKIHRNKQKTTMFLCVPVRMKRREEAPQTNQPNNQELPLSPGVTGFILSQDQ